MRAGGRSEKIDHLAVCDPRTEGQLVLSVAIRRCMLPSASWEYPSAANLFDPIRIDRFYS